MNGLSVKRGSNKSCLLGIPSFFCSLSVFLVIFLSFSPLTVSLHSLNDINILVYPKQKQGCPQEGRNFHTINLCHNFILHIIYHICPIYHTTKQTTSGLHQETQVSVSTLPKSRLFVYSVPIDKSKRKGLLLLALADAITPAPRCHIQLKNFRDSSGRIVHRELGQGKHQTKVKIGNRVGGVAANPACVQLDRGNVSLFAPKTLLV